MPEKDFRASYAQQVFGGEVDTEEDLESLHEEEEEKEEEEEAAEENEEAEDETLEEEEEVEDDDEEEEEDEEDLLARIERLEKERDTFAKASDGRLAQIDTLREETRRMKQVIQDLTTAEKKKKEEAEFGPEVTDAPAIKYLASKIEGSKPKEQPSGFTFAEILSQIPEEDRTALQEATKSHFAATSQDVDNKYGEGVFKAAFEHYGKSRIEYHKARGLSPAEAAEAMKEELIATNIDSLSRNQNPGAIVWNLAVQSGFRPKGAKKSGKKAVTSSEREAKKIKKASSRRSGRTSARSRGEKSGVLTWEEFQDKFSASERNAILMADRTIWRSFTKHGKADLSSVLSD